MAKSVSAIVAAVVSYRNAIGEDKLSEWRLAYPQESEGSVAILNVCYHALYSGEPANDSLRPWIMGRLNCMDSVQLDSPGFAYEEVLQAVDPETRSATGTWYTPDGVVDAMCNFAIEALGRMPQTVVDMACGQGAFPDGMLRAGAQHVEVWELQAVPALLTAEKYARDGAGVDVVCKNALHTVPSRGVDVVIGNPPYKAGGATGSATPQVERLFDGAGMNIYLQFHQLGGYMALPDGVLCMIHPNTVMTGDAGAKWRKRAMETADSVWIINVSPEGDLAPVARRVFPSVRSPLCITVLANGVRPGVWYTEVVGTRDEKISDLLTIGLHDDRWVRVAQDKNYTFLPQGKWATYTDVTDILSPANILCPTARTSSVGTTMEDLARRAQYINDNRAEVSSDVGINVKDYPAPYDGTVWDYQRVAHSRGDMRYYPVDPRLQARRGAEGVCIHIPNNNLPKRGAVASVSVGAHNTSYGGSGSMTRRSFAPYAGCAQAVDELYTGGVSAKETLPWYVLGVLGGSAYSDAFAQHLRFPGVRIPFPVDANMYREMVNIGQAVYGAYSDFFGVEDDGSDCVSRLVDKPVGVVETVRRDGDVVHVGSGEFIIPESAYNYSVNNRKLVEAYISGRSNYHNGGFIPSSGIGALPALPWSDEDTKGLLRCAWLSERLLRATSGHEQLLHDIIDNSVELELPDEGASMSLF